MHHFQGLGFSDNKASVVICDEEGSVAHKTLRGKGLLTAAVRVADS